MKRVHVIYFGRVQGVGFRFTAERFAQDFNLKGWVKNLSDGSVEIVAEGNESDLRQFLEKLKNYFKGYIQDIELAYSEATGEFQEFSIEF